MLWNPYIFSKNLSKIAIKFSVFSNRLAYSSIEDRTNPILQLPTLFLVIEAYVPTLIVILEPTLDVHRLSSLFSSKLSLASSPRT